MADIYLAISETPTVVTLTSAVINSAVASSVTVSNTVTVSLASVPTHAISGTVTANLALVGGFPNAVQLVSYDDDNLEYLTVAINTAEGPYIPTRIVGGTVTVGNTVTASISGTVPISISSVTVGNSVTIGSLPALAAGTAQIGSVTASISGTVPVSISSVTVGNSVTIGSLPAISGTVTANIAISSTAITSGSFASLTSATLVPANTARKMATVYNLGAGQLFVNAGSSATTLGGGFMVALSSGDYFECDYTTTTLSAIFATAGTASWVSH